MNHKKLKIHAVGSAGNMPFIEINHADSIAAHWKYDLINENVHLSIKSSFVGLGKFEIALNESKMLSKKRVLYDASFSWLLSLLCEL